MIARQTLGENFTWMHSLQPGAVQLRGNGAVNTNNDMLLMLDSALVDGFNELDVESVAFSGGSATITFASNHGYEPMQRIIVWGADDAALNGEHKIASATPKTVSINLLGISQTTGSIKTKIAPLGWESMFGDADALKRAYRSKNPSSTQTVLYLDVGHPEGHGYYAAAPTKRAMVSICEDMLVLGEQINSYTDVKNGTSVNGNLFWYQARVAGGSDVSLSAPGSWVIVGNGEVFYFFLTWSGTASIRATPARDFYAFGDMPSFGGASDNYSCYWQGSYNVNDKTNSGHASNGANVKANNVEASGKFSGYFIRSYTGLGDMEFTNLTPSGSSAGYISGAAAGIIFPNPVNQALVGVPTYLMTSNCLRAAAPRLLSIPQALNSTDTTSFDLTVIDQVLTIAVHTTLSTAPSFGYFAIDLGGS